METALAITVSVLLLWTNQAMFVGLLWMIGRKITGEYRAYWPWERGFWREWWIDLRVGLLWPWLIASYLRRVTLTTEETCLTKQ